MTWVQIPLHSVAEAIGVLAAFLLARLIFLLPRVNEKSIGHRVWASSALVAIGILDVFHAAAPPGDLFVWLHSISVLVGGFLFALVWLPGRIQAPLSYIFPIMAAITTTAFCILAISFPDAVPIMANSGVFTGTAIWVNTLGGVLLLLAGVRYAISYGFYRENEDLLFATLTILFGLAGVLFQFSAAWEAGWWFWHLLRLLSYVVAAVFVLHVFQQAQISLAGTNEALREEIRGHQQAEAALQHAQEGLEQRVQERTSDLTKVIQEAQEAVGILSSSVSEILTAVSQLAASTTETATAVSETTSTVEEVKQTAQLSTDKAKNIAEAGQVAAQVLKASQQNVDESVAEMDRIRDQMDAIGETIMYLSEQSQAIGEITATVNELAEQSNLLSVNAAIEAAKAGEQGKGFAVVAQEIKILAEQSKQATAQVRNLLADIQKAISTSAMVTEQTSKVVENGVRQSDQAGKSIRVAVDAAMSAADASRQILASSQQQLIGVDQVAIAIKNINQASTQNAETTRQVKLVAQNLHELSQKLKLVVEGHV